MRSGAKQPLTWHVPAACLLGYAAYVIGISRSLRVDALVVLAWFLPGVFLVALNAALRKPKIPTRMIGVVAGGVVLLSGMMVLDRWPARSSPQFFDWIGVLVAIPQCVLLVTWIFAANYLLGRRADRQGVRCADCDYDLQGNTSGVCPECGLAIQKPPGE